MDGAGWLWLLTGLVIGALGVGMMSGRFTCGALGERSLGQLRATIIAVHFERKSPDAEWHWGSRVI